jgi:hypothetical protein
VAHTPCSPRPFGLAGASRARAPFPPFLSLSWRARPSARLLSPRVHPLSLLVGPLCQLPRPRVTACPTCVHRGLRAHVARRARNRPALGHLSPRAPLTLSLPHLRTCRTPFQPPPRCAHASEEPPLPAVVPSPFPRRRRSPAMPSATVSFASTSATRDMLQFLLSLPDFLCPRLPAILRAAAVVRRRRLEPSSRLRRHREVSGVRLEVRNLPCPLLFPPMLPVVLNFSSESVGTAAEPSRRGPPPSGAPNAT